MAGGASLPSDSEWAKKKGGHGMGDNQAPPPPSPAPPPAALALLQAGGRVRAMGISRVEKHCVVPKRAHGPKRP